MRHAFLRSGTATLSLLVCAAPTLARAQASTPPQRASADEDQRITDLTHEVQDLRNLVRQLQDQVARLSAAQSGTASRSQDGSTAAAAANPATETAAPTPSETNSSRWASNSVTRAFE